VQRLAGASELPVLDWLARVRLTRPLPVLPPLWRHRRSPARFFSNTIIRMQRGRAGMLPAAVLEPTCTPPGPGLAFDWCDTPTGPAPVFPGTCVDGCGGAELIWMASERGTGNGAPASRT